MIHADCRDIKLVKGEKGVTFIPHISEDGTLTFTNDGGLENPPAVKLKLGGNSDITNDDIATDEEVKDVIGDIFDDEEDSGESSGGSSGDNTEGGESSGGDDTSGDDIATDDEVNDMLEDIFGNKS